MVRTAEELRDGSIVVIDRRERRVDRVWFDRDTSVQIGRAGSGPLEIAYPVRLLNLGRGRVAIDDASNERWLVIGANGTLEKPFALGEPTSLNYIARRSSGIPTSTGSVMYASARRGGDVIAEWFPNASEPREVSRRAPPLLRAGAAPSGVSARASGTSAPPYLSPADYWTAALDGQVAVVTGSPYRVTFFSLDGAQKQSSIMTVPAQMLTRRTREEMVLELARQRGDQAPRDGRYDWPDVLPAIHGDAFSTIRFAPDGKLWVRRTTLAESLPAFDVFSRDATISERVRLPAKSRLAGFGAAHLLLVVRDDDDVEYIRRVPFKY